MTNTIGSHNKFGALAFIAIMGMVFSSTVFADSGSKLPINTPKAYAQECTACHIAYPPGMLPKQSWQRIMAGLDKHYGTDASLDDATVKQLSTWLETQSGTYKRVAEVPPNDRITQSAWFIRKHKEITPSVWKLPSVKSEANCAACHSSADKGIYSDNTLKFPIGIDARSKRAWNN